jgi:transketolase
MRVGIATDHGGFGLKEDLVARKNLHHGVREHATAAIVNGLSISKLRAFGVTFFIFSDYARPSMRLSAIMELPAILIFTHDAMGDGEDGPTHQPVEHLALMRATPGLVTLTPADANEVMEVYRYIQQPRHVPTVPVLSRQPLPTFDRSRYAAASNLARGRYVLADVPGENPEVIPIASRSDVSIAVNAHETLVAEGIRSRAVSMPSWDTIEEASTLGWERYVGDSGRISGMKTFGTSAPPKELQSKFGFEPERVVAAKEPMGRA